jgi:hypothetical protein
LSLRIHPELKYVRPGIVPNYIEASPSYPDALDIKLGVQDPDFLSHWPGGNLAPGRNDHRVTRIDPFFVLGK